MSRPQTRETAELLRELKELATRVAAITNTMLRYRLGALYYQKMLSELVRKQERTYQELVRSFRQQTLPRKGRKE